MFKLSFSDPSIKYLTYPLVTIVVLVVLIIVTINVSYPGINNKLTEIREAKTLQNSLNERLDVLKTFNSGTIDDRSEQIYTVMPDKNASALMVSQLKGDLATQNINLTGIEASPVSGENEIKRSDLIYKFETDTFESSIQLVLSMKNSAPITSIEEVKMAKEPDGKVTTELKTGVFWADLPVNLPDVTEALSSLNAEDQELLDRILRYRFPIFTALSPELHPERVNPFD